MALRHRTRRDDRAAALVEFALLAPLLFMILMGTVTGGFALSEKNNITNAVREGARVGATLPKGASWNAWATSVDGRVLELAAGDLTTSQVCVQITARPSGTVLGSNGGTCGATPATPASATSGCVIKVWARGSADLNALFIQRTLALDAQAVGRYERTETDCP
jgi:hypothetical protein